jgi:hypothetical protein
MCSHSGEYCSILVYLFDMKVPLNVIIFLLRDILMKHSSEITVVIFITNMNIVTYLGVCDL